MEKRQRKYRAWHVERKEMLYNDFSIIATSPSWSGTQNYGSNDEELRLLLREWDTKRGDILGGDYTLIDWACFSDLIVMDWSGFNDTEGKEIYEGDVFEIKAGYNYYVVFENGSFTCYHIETKDYILGGNLKWGLLSRSFELGSDYKPKVIGNIYQNPELLTS